MTERGGNATKGPNPWFRIGNDGNLELVVAGTIGANQKQVIGEGLHPVNHEPD
jgi:hypothetical protein